jgi:Gas vesicle synthesis protein GvpO
VSNGRPTPLRTVITNARAQLSDLTGRPTEAVASVARDEDGWVLSIEVVELHRVPDSTSILGCYEVRVDREGNLLEYGRTSRYHRNQAGEDGQ